MVVTGNLAYISGHISLDLDGSVIKGKVGQDLTAEEAKLAARKTGYLLLSTLRAHFGSLDRIHKVVKILGMINAVPEFEQHAYVMNGCSELFAEIWGPELGVGARSAVGMGSLPRRCAIEIEVIFELT
ncbi:MAG: RidA family protein [Spirosomataceae bacterium]